MMNSRIFSTLIVAVLFLGCTSAPQVDLEAERTSLQAAAEAYHTAAIALDIDGLAALYAENSRVFPPDQDEIRGLDNIRIWLAGFLEISNFQATFEPPIVQVSPKGGYGYSFASATLSYDTPDGTHVSESNRDIHVWEKYPDGSWRVVVDIWNLPPEMASEDM